MVTVGNVGEGLPKTCVLQLARTRQNTETILTGGAVVVVCLGSCPSPQVPTHPSGLRMPSFVIYGILMVMEGSVEQEKEGSSVLVQTVGPRTIGMTLIADQVDAECPGN